MLLRISIAIFTNLFPIHFSQNKFHFSRYESYTLNNSTHKQTYELRIKQRIINAFYATNLTPKKCLWAKVYMYIVYCICFIFSVCIIYFVKLAFSDLPLFQIYVSIYMLHYASSHILNVLGSSPKKLNVVLYVFSFIDGYQTYKITFNVNSNDELCVDLFRVYRYSYLLGKRI